MWILDVFCDHPVDYNTLQAEWLKKVEEDLIETYIE